MYLPEAQERPLAVVISIGPDVQSTDIKVGSLVFWLRDISEEFEIDGFPYARITESMIVGIVDDAYDVVVSVVRRDAESAKEAA